MLPATSTPIRHAETEDHNGNSNLSFASTTETSATFPYPSCWRDDERMNVLFSSFRNRDVNPENYDSKMKFWQDIIAQYCEHKSSSCFCKRELQQVFTRGQKIPYCLDAVLEEMMRTKAIRRRVEYEYDPENTWIGWAMNCFVKKPLAWGVHKLKSIVNWQTPDDLCEYVHLHVMQMLCKELETKVLQLHEGELLHYAAARELIVAALPLKEDCLRLCLHTLHAQHKIVLEYTRDSKEQHLHLIKIPAKTDADITITETDHAVHRLRMTQQGLLKQLESMEQDIKTNDEKARAFVKANERTMAKTYLRKKHLLEQSYAKRSASLHNIDSLLVSVDEAQSNGEILDAYKIGARALQALNESELRYDNVNEVVMDVRDALDAHRELQDSMANANLALDTTQDENDELERELKELFGEQSKTATTNPIKMDNNNKAAEEQTKEALTLTAAIAKTSDAELLAMLEGLEVEDNSLVKREQSDAKKQLTE